MTRYLRQHHLALLALFIALGGTSYAAAKLPGNSVGANQIKAGAVTSSEVKNRSLRAGDFRPGALPAGRQGAGGAQGARGVQGAQGPAGPSNVYSAFKTGPLQLPNESGDAGQSATVTIATLGNLPPGAYSILAKLNVFSFDGAPAIVICQLETGQDFDRAHTYLPSTFENQLVLNVVRTFQGTGGAVLKCTDRGNDIRADYVKITATRVGSVRNLPSP